VRRFQRAAGLSTDGVYGSRTRAALARELGVPLRELPPTMTGTSSPAPADSAEPPSWLPTAAALARWTEDARASDATASTKLARLAPHAASIAPMTETAMQGIEVGEIPPAPSPSSASAWASSAWSRARAEGEAARARLASHARGITQEAERALTDVRRAIDRETDTAVRGALEALERSLVAILRPTAQAIRHGITEPLGAGAVLVGLAILAAYAASRGR
jgi:peptidoglycan hydrolase-like protein with peptidoglycan-binding domain